MMKRTERGWFAKLRQHVDETVRFFSEDGRDEHEKVPIREFIKYLGVQFNEEELTVPAPDDDVDVHFGDAKFQNAEDTDDGRRRHDEVRRFAARVRKTPDVAALEALRLYSVPMGIAELLRKVVSTLEKKTRKTARRAQLDALVYVNLHGRHLHPAPDFIEDPSAVAELGWRSVSVLWPPYAIVVCAQPTAPKFLRAKARRVIRYSGIPWEDGTESTSPAPIADLVSATLAASAALGYVGLGGLVLATRASRDVISALGVHLRMREPLLPLRVETHPDG